MAKKPAKKKPVRHLQSGRNGRWALGEKGTKNNFNIVAKTNTNRKKYDMHHTKSVNGKHEFVDWTTVRSGRK
jgi:hypothetical protein